ncbi:transglutaminase domain-containing protein [Nocardioides sp. W3-2-3]|nr:transglutaminase-like domain-containing protein [Nocardioides convexus]NHA01483.1 transglutaminase domain-containing protein [Nocardioides convexus]
MLDERIDVREPGRALAAHPRYADRDSASTARSTTSRPAPSTPPTASPGCPTTSPRRATLRSRPTWPRRPSRTRTRRRRTCRCRTSVRRGPSLEQTLLGYAQEATATSRTPYEKAEALEQAVRGSRRVDPDAPSGSSGARIVAFLGGEPGTWGAQTGTSEQFATAFALLARMSGLPTRLVVGFKAGTEQADGTRLVHGRDALAWPEVYFEGQGWVPFQPTPEDNTFSRPDVKPPPEQAPPPPTPTDQPSETATPEPQQPTTDQPGASGGGGTALPWWPLAVAGLVLPFLALALARGLRSLRQRRGGARGAWAEVLDYLVLAGRPAGRHESASQVAERARAGSGTPEVVPLAHAAEHAAFGPDPAPERGPAPAALAVVRRAARRTVPAWRRLWWPFDPRPLLRGGSAAPSPRRAPRPASSR